MGMFQKLKSRGVLLTCERLFNQYVPPWIFRFSVGDVLDLNAEQLYATHKEFLSDEFIFEVVEDPQKRSELRTITWNSVPLSSSENDYGYAIMHAEETPAIIGGVWGGIESFLEANLGFRIELENDQAWIYCAFVDEEARGKRIYQRLLAFAGYDLKNRGYNRLRVVIQPWNKASMYVHKKYSDRSLGRIIAVRIFNLAMVFCTGTLRKSHCVTTQLKPKPVLIQIP